MTLSPWPVLLDHYSAAIYRSTNNGASWHEFLYVGVTHPDALFSLITHMEIVGGKLYAQGLDYGGPNGGNHPYSRVYNGASWGYGPELSNERAHEPTIFNSLSISRQGSSLVSFDGTTETSLTGELSNPVIDFTLYDGFLYVLYDDGTIKRTDNLSSWRYIDTAPTKATCIEILNDIIYVGTDDSQIHTSNRLETLPDFNIVPILYLMLLDETE